MVRWPGQDDHITGSRYAQHWRINLKRSYVAGITAGRVGDRWKIVSPRSPALVGGRAAAGAPVNRRTAGEQRVGERRTAIVGEGKHLSIYIELIARRAESGAAAAVANEIVAGGE